MKRRHRCPLCKSMSIKEITPEGDKKTDNASKNEKTTQDKEKKWKCYDCYRIFDKPDETEY